MGRLKVIASIALGVLVLGMLGFILTKDSGITDQTSEETMLELKTNQKASKDTIEKSDNTKITTVVNQYYKQKAEEQQFAESYQDVTVYIAQATEQDDYIAYVTYQMQIKDVETLLPGMETLYLKPAVGDTYEIVDVASDQALQDEIDNLSQDEEVQALIQSVEDGYQTAKEKDPVLAAALADLQKAYQ